MEHTKGRRSVTAECFHDADTLVVCVVDLLTYGVRRTLDTGAHIYVGFCVYRNIRTNKSINIIYALPLVSCL